jgi:dUTP diphosphatase
LLHPSAKIPTYSQVGDAGADIYSVDWGVLAPKERMLISTGIALEIPLGYVGFIQPRSGLASKLGVTVLNTPGTIDAGYRGEIKVNLINTNVTPYSFCIGDRIAQIIFQKVEFARFGEVEDLSDSERGEEGHGSTGGFNG